jgi:ATP-dependent RNA helicase RhlE
VKHDSLPDRMSVLNLPLAGAETICMTFTNFPLHERLQRAVAAAGFQDPTPIQAAAIPVALDGRDILGTAQTGTGKTAAFALPVLHRLLTAPTTGKRTRALVLAPTRELADQVQQAIRQLSAHTNLRAAAVYGGVGMAQQERALANGTEIIVACPGRLLDHAGRGTVDFSGIECLVIDEADRMLDMGFLPDVRRILGKLPTERQTMLFSATFAPELTRFAEGALRNPARIAVDITAPPQTIRHALYPVPALLKSALLLELLKQMNTDSVLIFTRTKHRADRVSRVLSRAGIKAAVLHANRTQSQRTRAMTDFRSGAVPCLVATDIAARGIDIATISHVINFDIPDTADTYIHRIGRTGRAERSGEAFTLVTNEDYAIIAAIERALGERLPTATLEGFDYQQSPAADAVPAAGGSHTNPQARTHPGMSYLSSPAYRERLATVGRG